MEIRASAAVRPSYLEAAEFFGTIPSDSTVVTTGGATAWVETPSYADGTPGPEVDLDSILAEIERISGEILKKT